MKPSVSKQLKNISYKGTVVNTNHGSHFRKPYEKQMEVNTPIVAIKKNKSSLENKPIESSKPLETGKGGISNGVEFVKFKDGSTAFFKPVDGEPFVRKVASA